MTPQIEQKKPACKILVLDAGPLLNLSPLRGLAETFYTVPQVLEELKDKRAREHFRQLGLSAGVRIEVKRPDAVALSHVINFAKKTGDYSVLSHADMCILALTYALSKEEEDKAKTTESTPAEESSPEATSVQAEASGSSTSKSIGTSRLAWGLKPPVVAAEADEVEEPPQSEESSDENVEELGHSEAIKAMESNPADSGDPQVDGAEYRAGEDEETEKLDVELHRASDEDSSTTPPSESTRAFSEEPSASTLQNDNAVYDDPSDEDDGEGEWITPSNVALHKSRAVGLLPEEDANAKKGTVKQIDVGCMTADFAMQNVLLQMGLSLVGVEGKKIQKVKTWVLRCHACFKICKDNSRKFCPSCGNSTLLRASVTLSSPTATSSTPTLQVHLKKNFQYKTRGTIYSIPAPKPGTAKTGSGEGLVLREDQTTWLRAQKYADGKRERQEKKMLNGVLHGKADTGGVVISSWMDPDWVPEILSTGTGDWLWEEKS
ncbi:hypothetical protein EUX98_g5392 [Antrodiella citrinella]|uniref:20S-pre-rRNA D-site endonuclease NOB1 n=1 Tax=Antrodiella citrinella TaxID=2447956 RepID=A0A4S4MRK3_9APHY|nr:hypothetical protein EUX98_g5392 [Antrodiella citrinella]